MRSAEELLLVSQVPRRMRAVAGLGCLVLFDVMLGSGASALPSQHACVRVALATQETCELRLPPGDWVISLTSVIGTSGSFDLRGEVENEVDPRRAHAFSAQCTVTARGPVYYYDYEIACSWATTTSEAGSHSVHVVPAATAHGVTIRSSTQSALRLYLVAQGGEGSVSLGAL